MLKNFEDVEVTWWRKLLLAAAFGCLFIPVSIGFLEIVLGHSEHAGLKIGICLFAAWSTFLIKNIVWGPKDGKFYRLRNWLFFPIIVILAPPLSFFFAVMILSRLPMHIDHDYVLAFLLYFVGAAAFADRAKKWKSLLVEYVSYFLILLFLSPVILSSLFALSGGF